MSYGTKISAALVKAQSQFTAIPKGSTNPFFKSKYAALPDVVLAATPILAANGLAVTQLMTSVDGTDALTTVLLHESGESIESTMLLHLAKNDPQAQGSAVTYARRYSYMSILGLVADVDDDGHKATESVARKVQQKNSALDLLRGELIKVFSLPSERKEFVAGIVGRVAKAEELNDEEIALVMLALSADGA